MCISGSQPFYYQTETTWCFICGVRVRRVSGCNCNGGWGCLIVAGRGSHLLVWTGSERAVKIGELVRLISYLHPSLALGRGFPWERNEGGEISSADSDIPRDRPAGKEDRLERDWRDFGCFWSQVWMKFQTKTCRVSFSEGVTLPQLHSQWHNLQVPKWFLYRFYSLQFLPNLLGRCILPSLPCTGLPWYAISYELVKI